MVKSTTIFDELVSCNQNPFVDITFKLTITIKNYSKQFIWLSWSNRIIHIVSFIHEGNLGLSIFFLEGYLPLIQKDSSTHMHGLAVYIKERLSVACNLSLENSADSYLCFPLALLHSVLLLFPLSVNCFVFVYIFGFYFIQHRWGSLDQPVC